MVGNPEATVQSTLSFPRQRGLSGVRGVPCESPDSRRQSCGGPIIGLLNHPQFPEAIVVPLTEEERAIYYPADRRFRIWIRPSVLILIAVLILIPLSIAWVQTSVWGFPYIAPNAAAIPGAETGPHGFPAWIRWSHFSICSLSSC